MGLSWLARCARMTGIAAIPIVMMTSLRAAVPPTPGLYEAVLGKPFTPEALLKVLDGFLSRQLAMAMARSRLPGESRNLRATRAPRPPSIRRRVMNRRVSSCLTHSRSQPEGHSDPPAWSHVDRIPPRAHGAGPVHSQTLSARLSRRALQVQGFDAGVSPPRTRPSRACQCPKDNRGHECCRNLQRRRPIMAAICTRDPRPEQ